MATRIARRNLGSLVGLLLVLFGVGVGLATPHTAQARTITPPAAGTTVQDPENPFTNDQSRTDALAAVKKMKFWMFIFLAAGFVGWIVAFGSQVFAPQWYNGHKGFIHGFLIVLLLSGVVFNYIINQAVAAQNEARAPLDLATAFIAARWG